MTHDLSRRAAPSRGTVCPLPVARCPLPVARCPLPVARCPLPVALHLKYPTSCYLPGKSLILTTHALEEAEALCDRVGMMTFGQMRTIGTPTELRLRFDQGYKLLVAIDGAQPQHESAVDAFVREVLPRAALVDAINGVRTYMVPKDGVSMSTVFSQIIGRREALHIKDWGLWHTTLEEVFLQIVRANTLEPRFIKQPDA